MNKAKRNAVIAGNWKMNKSRAEAKALVEELRPLVAEAGCKVVVCTPYLDLETAVNAAAGSNIGVGAQNCHWADHGAFTGEIPAAMLAEVKQPLYRKSSTFCHVAQTSALSIYKMTVLSLLVLKYIMI